MLQGGRIRLKGWQQAAVAVGSAFGALMDPRRADFTPALGEATGKQPRRQSYITHLVQLTQDLSPDDRPSVRFMGDIGTCICGSASREVHDFWHTLFDHPTNLIGESAVLTVIEFKHMYLPLCLLSVVGSTARFNEKQRALSFKH
ncbi:hypothetical protein MKW98_023157 [Papaver atlanticum]|uniref:Uncharacterized protein n=1 Tax=Papaver atlanticum TaxID=357466 RepID=A0AAD4TB45_9MAGN|nr:hypothetical protein MKW98_023157 [Papaver atlanticum]